MSRTKKGSKGPSYDYWSRRANGVGKRLFSTIGRIGKKLMNRGARHRDKQSLKGQV